MPVNSSCGNVWSWHSFGPLLCGSPVGYSHAQVNTHKARRSAQLSADRASHCLFSESGCG